MMLCNHDTDFFLDSITTAQGRRYNVLPPDSGVEPLVGRNISRDDVAGFFNALKLNDQHTAAVKFINTYQIADHEMLIEHMEMNFKKFKRLIDECIAHGLVYENIIVTEFTGIEKEYHWYLIDTGGIYVLESLKERYKILPFTTCLEEKYKIYLKAQFLFDNNEFVKFKNMDHCETRNGKTYRVELIEEVHMKSADDYKNTIFIVNLETLKKLNISELVKTMAKNLAGSGNKFYDVSSKNFIDLDLGIDNTKKLC